MIVLTEASRIAVTYYFEFRGGVVDDNGQVIEIPPGNVMVTVHAPSASAPFILQGRTRFYADGEVFEKTNDYSEWFTGETWPAGTRISEIVPATRAKLEALHAHLPGAEALQEYVIDGGLADMVALSSQLPWMNTRVVGTKPTRPEDLN